MFRVVLAVLALASLAHAKEAQSLPITLELGHRSSALPFSHVLAARFSPAVSVGTELSLISGRAGALVLPLKLGALSNGPLGWGLSASAEIQYRYTFSFGLSAAISSGFGYLHNFHPAQVYRQNAAGRFVAVADAGSPTATASTALSLGYDFRKVNLAPFEVFVRYAWLVQAPYFENVVPVAMQQLVSVGARWYWKGL